MTHKKLSLRGALHLFISIKFVNFLFDRFFSIKTSILHGSCVDVLFVELRCIVFLLRAILEMSEAFVVKEPELRTASWCLRLC